MKLFNNILSKLCHILPIRGRFIASLALPLLALAATSCSNEEEAIVETQENNTFTINFSIPRAAFADGLATRASNEYLDPIDTDRQEGNLQSLYMLVLQEDQDFKGSFIYYDCKDLKSQVFTSVGPVYAQEYNYREEFTIGRYKFYFFANIAEYWAKGLSKNKEDFPEFLKSQRYIEHYIEDDLLLKFDRLIEADNLPMICYSKDILVEDDAENKIPLKDITDENGVGILNVNQDLLDTYQGSNKQFRMYVPLSIQCAKVRYTVLFDNTKADPTVPGSENGFSSMFPNADVHFTPLDNTGIGQYIGEISISNVYTNTLLKVPASDLSTADSDWINQTSSIHQTEYPKAEIRDSQGEVISASTLGYLSIQTQESSPNYLTQFLINTANSWDPEGQRAWQGGAIYLPENTTYSSGIGDDAKVTTLHLSATGTGIKEEDYNVALNNLSRGHFYDVVVKLINSDVLAVEIYVKVNPWTYNPSQNSW